MPKFSSRVGKGLQSSKGGKITAKKVLANPKAKPLIKKVVQSVAPIAQKVFSAIKEKRGAALPIGGAIPVGGGPMIEPELIDQLSPQVYIHALANMDMPTFNMLKGIAANYLQVQHPVAAITRHLLGGDFVHPKSISKIATRDIMKAATPQQYSEALHSEWMDMMANRLSPAERGGGLFASLKMLVKKGVSGAGKALKSVAAGAKSAVRALSAGAMGAQMIGKSLSNAIMQGVEVANVLAPAVGTVFPKAEGIIRTGVDKANAANELLKRGVDISQKVETGLAPVIQQLGPIDDPIVVGLEQEPVGAGLDDLQMDAADVEQSDISGPRFIS